MDAKEPIPQNVIDILRELRLAGNPMLNREQVIEATRKIPSAHRWLYRHKSRYMEAVTAMGATLSTQEASIPPVVSLPTPKRNGKKAIAAAVEKVLESQSFHEMERENEQAVKQANAHIETGLSRFQIEEVEGNIGPVDEDGVIQENDLADAREELSRLAERYSALDDSVESAPIKPSMDEYVERGKAARREMDGGKWKLCYLAAQVVVDHGDDSLGEWAAGVGVASSTARHYRRMELFFPIARRLAKCDQFRTPDGDDPLVFSHFAQALVLPTPDIAYEWLEIVAHMPNWSVDVAQMKLNEWIKLRGYTKRKPGKQPTKSKVEICKFSINRPSFSQMNGEWYVTFRITEDEPMIKAAENALKTNPNQILQLTLVKQA